MAANQSSARSPRSGTQRDARPAITSPGSPGVPAAGGRKRWRNRGGDGEIQTFRSPTAVVIWVVWLLFAAASWIDLAVQGRDHTSVVAAALLLLVTGIAYVTAQRPRIIADNAGLAVRNPLRDHRIGWAGVAKVDLADLLRVHCARGGQGGSGGIGPPSHGGSRGVAPPDQHSVPPDKHLKVISSWAVAHSRRRQLVAETKARRASRSQRSSFGLASGGHGLASGGHGLASGGRGLPYGSAAGPAAAKAEADAEMIVRLLNERATAARAEAVWATGTAEVAGAKEDTGTGSSAGTAGGAGWLEPLKSTWSRPAIAAIIIPALILLTVCLV